MTRFFKDDLDESEYIANKMSNIGYYNDMSKAIAALKVLVRMNRKLNPPFGGEQIKSMFELLMKEELEHELEMEETYQKIFSIWKETNDSTNK